MGQTLSHGVYLPAEGERNCYSGLASNWNLLDTAIGDTAGKASATHTHGNISSDGKVGTTANLPLITGTGGAVQAGSFGNAANTFCEGNDSRLSDARTPVAHTHTKSDVTDLLNSNFIPSANNSYDLGSSSYQWNNLYAKNYFYNGTAWGLDKANVWSGENIFSNTLSITGNTLFARDRPQVTIGTIPSSTVFYGTTRFRDSNNTSFAFERGAISTTWNYRQWFVHNFSNASINASFEIGIKHDGTEKYFLIDADKVIPNTTGVSDLGTSDKKWKTLNGINPGALSLPKTDSSATAIETSGFSFDGTSERIPDTVNIFSNGEALMNGWLCARLKEGAGHYVFLSSDDNTGRYGISSSCFSNGVASTLLFGINAYVPIKVGDKPAIRWAKPNGGNAQLIFYPCLGNV